MPEGPKGNTMGHKLEVVSQEAPILLVNYIAFPIILLGDYFWDGFCTQGFGFLATAVAIDSWFIDHQEKVG